MCFQPPVDLPALRTSNFVTVVISIFGFFLQVQSAVPSMDSTRCPSHLSEVQDGYTAVHDHICYLFVNDEVYWKRAREECYKLGGEMLSVESEATMNFLAEALSTNKMGWNRDGVWLGARYRKGMWRWTNGRKVQYENWQPGEPSRILGGLLSLEDCAQMRREDGWRWHDYPCGSLRYHYNFICQFPLSKPSDLEGQVAPSAANQTEDNGNTQTLVVIIAVAVALLFVVLVLALLLHVYHRRTKRSQAGLAAVHYTNNNNGVNGSAGGSSSHHHTNTVSNGSGGAGGGSSSGGSATYSGASSSGSGPTTGRLMSVPSGIPPRPPSDQSTVPFLYSEVNKSRTPPHLQMVSFPDRGNHAQLNLATTAITSPVTNTSVNTAPYTTINRNTTTAANPGHNLDSDLELAPLITPSSSGDPLLGNEESESGGSLSTTTTSAPPSLPPPFSLAVGCGGQAMSETQQQQTSSGDYVDMNSLILKEGQGHRQGHCDSQTVGKVAAKPVVDEDKHTYTNVNQRQEKVENVYEVLP